MLLYLTCRFPGGESYCDLIKRLDSVIVDLEQQVTPTLVVSHVSVLQMLMAYFRNSPVEQCMDIDIPLHCVIKFTPARGGGWKESAHELAPVMEKRKPTITTNDTIGDKKPAETSGGFWPLKLPFFGGGNHIEKKQQDSVTSPAISDFLDERTHRGQPV